MSKFAEYIEAWRAKDAAIYERVSRKQRELWEILPDVSRKLKAFGAKEVIIFGSLVEEDFKEGSDVDIATKGLPGDRYIDALIMIEKMLITTGVDFDLVIYERAHPWIKERIEKGRAI